ncbi:lymphocyte antigen 96 isoform X6 [Dermochelys coriacea]|uniref:lymphocyte antigen 96 isoform X6 n=1 Tax=Dermochelys coriacea TaxID=27794 RepID=UPI001CA7E5FF|nr:lymphocyte antigen 96 isoform X6 [Dermochelys coriacea]
MFQLVFFILFTSGFTESQGKKVLCGSSDVEISYSFCESDIIFLEGSMDLWYDAASILQWTEVICHGFDDDYSFCGTLKGETVNTTFELSGLKMPLPKKLFIVAMEDYQQPLHTYLERLMLTSPKPRLLTSAA